MTRDTSRGGGRLRLLPFFIVLLTMAVLLTTGGKSEDVSGETGAAAAVSPQTEPAEAFTPPPPESGIPIPTPDGTLHIVLGTARDTSTDTEYAVVGVSYASADPREETARIRMYGHSPDTPTERSFLSGSAAGRNDKGHLVVGCSLPLSSAVPSSTLEVRLESFDKDDLPLDDYSRSFTLP